MQFNKYTHTHTHTHTRKGLGRVEGGQKSARNRKIAVNAVRETGETWVESEKNVEKKGLVQYLPTRITWGATRKQGGEHKVLRAQVRFVQVERVCPLCRV